MQVSSFPTQTPVFTDQEAAKRLRDRIAREIAGMCRDGNTGLIETVLPAYKWLSDLAGDE